MLNKFILMAALFFVASTSYATRSTDGAANTGTNDDADDVQTVNITVPEVALLDVTGNGGDQSVINITVPTVTNAGVGLSPTASAETVTYALTSNVAHNNGAISQTRTLTVEMAAASFLPAGGKLVITSGAGTENGDGVDHTNTEITNASRSGNLATNIRNIAATGQTLTYSLEPIISGSTMSFTGTDGTSSESITLTYTLSAGQ